MTSDGDGPDLAQLLVAGYGKAYRTAYLITRNPADAEEAVQEAFLRVWRFRSALPDGRGIEPWVYRVLVNTCYSQLRRTIPVRQRTAADADLASRPAPDSTEGAATAATTADAVIDALADLPEHLRVPTVLRYWTGLSEREIATAIRRRPGTVKSRLHEARRRLAGDPRIAALAPANRISITGEGTA
jgi:RNA polymerase sigma-70 factor (ECF subfamily)